MLNIFNTKTRTKNKTKTKTKSTVKKSKITKKNKKIKNINEVGILDNGLKFVVKTNNTQKTTAIILIVKTGSINEGKYHGLSHLLEHLLFTGTKNYPNSQELVNELEKNGSRINAYTDQETTGYYITCHHSKINKTVKMLAEMIQETNLDNYRIQNEKKIVENEIKYRQDKMSSYANKLLINKLLNKTEFGNIVIGTPETLGTIEKYHLLAYLVSRYKPENMVLSITGNLGNLNFKKILNLIKTNFGEDDLTKHYQINKGLFQYENYSKALDYFNNINKKELNNQLEISKKINYGYNNIILKSKLVYVNIVFNAFGIIKKNNQDQKNVDLLNFINDYLDLGMSSKLFEIVREENYLVYNIGCKNIKFSSFGFFSIQYPIMNDIELIQKSINIVFEIIKNLKNELLDKRIIKNIQNKNDNRQRSRNLNVLDVSLKRAEFILFSNIKTNFFKKNYLLNPLKIKEGEEFHNKINKKLLIKNKKNEEEDSISSIQIKNFANKLFNKDKMNIIILSSRKIKSSQLKFNI